jgi:hypothetical protein
MVHKQRGRPIRRKKETTKKVQDKRFVCDWKTNPMHKSFGEKSGNNVAHLVLALVWLEKRRLKDSTEAGKI